MTKGLVPFAEDDGSLANDLYRFGRGPFVLPQDPWVSAADLVLSVNETSSLDGGLFMLAKGSCQHARALFVVVEDVCRLAEGLLSFADCGRRMSEVLCSPAMDLCILAKDLCRLSEDLVPLTPGLDQEAEDSVPRTTGLGQEAEDLVSLPKGVREKPTDLHQGPNGVFLLAEDICRYSRVLVHGSTNHFLLNKGHLVFSKSGVSRSKRLSQVSFSLRLESEELFVEPEQLCGQGSARSAMRLVLPNYPSAYGAISSDGNRRFVGGAALASRALEGPASEAASRGLAAVAFVVRTTQSSEERELQAESLPSGVVSDRRLVIAQKSDVSFTHDSRSLRTLRKVVVAVAHAAKEGTRRASSAAAR